MHVRYIENPGKFVNKHFFKSLNVYGYVLTIKEHAAFYEFSLIRRHYCRHKMAKGLAC